MLRSVDSNAVILDTHEQIQVSYASYEFLDAFSTKCHLSKPVYDISVLRASRVPEPLPNWAAHKLVYAKLNPRSASDELSISALVQGSAAPHEPRVGPCCASTWPELYDGMRDYQLNTAKCGRQKLTVSAEVDYYHKPPFCHPIILPVASNWANRHC